MYEPRDRFRAPDQRGSGRFHNSLNGPSTDSEFTGDILNTFSCGSLALHGLLYGFRNLGSTQGLPLGLSALLNGVSGGWREDKDKVMIVAILIIYGGFRMSVGPQGPKRKYQTVAEIQGAIDAYFKRCDDLDKPYTVSMMAYYLGMTREGLIGYQRRDDTPVEREIADAIKKAKQKVLGSAEERLQGGQQAAGVIFALKNNYGWQDKQEIEHSGSIQTGIEAALEAARQQLEKGGDAD